MGRSTAASQVVLACEVCKSRNYRKRKRRDAQAPRLELKKFCPRCRAHSRHVESR